MKPKVSIDEDEIKVRIVSPKKEEIKEKRKFNSNNASITNRICNSS